ncbi:D-alanyl-D-alanine carboxypeptidase/D-alanyl-D-alanine-endopeptidase [Pannus brasiliensis CCIBt3594]|uniref:D-alanyl-D-alanine carboxypeptidase/D-alanyl-D-alanine-endopeptidase n=1 Tax=Pannus brasiliensis CCIBt3594 TaxID=1427578 RepID=A0AAW9QLG0_9CHRO
MLSRFSIFPLFLFAFTLFPSPKPVVADTPPSRFICPSELETGIDRILQREEFTRSYWGILIQPLHSNQSLYRRNENKFFIPASNAKLLTTAAALQAFPPDYRIKTPVLARGNAPNLETLTVVGKGDPTLTTEKLQTLARQLKDRGIRQIDRLQVDDSFFPRSNLNKTWEWEDIFFYYAVAPSSLTLNENAVKLEVSPTRVGQPISLQWSDTLAARQWSIENRATTAPAGTPNTLEIKGNLGDSRLIITGSLAIDAKDDFSIAIPDPTRYFLDRWREILQDEGITVKSAGITPEPVGEEITSIESDPISQIVQRVNTESHNFFAETLLQLIGGTEGVKERLTGLGINSDGYSLQDGSGLSRQNLTTPETLVRALQLFEKNATYRDSLAIAGVRGTLAGRFQNTPIQGRLQGKTGTLSGVVSLSGYLENPNYDSIAFSILVNHSDRPATITRNGIDEIILLLGRLKRC